MLGLILIVGGRWRLFPHKGRSKIEFKSELHNAWIAHTRNCAEPPEAIGSVEAVGIGMVEHIESLGAKLRVEAIIRF